MIIQQPAANTTIYATNPTDQSVTGNTAPQSTPLSLELQPNSSYSLELNAPFNLAGIVPGYKFILNGPTSPLRTCINPRIVTSLGTIVSQGIITGFGTGSVAALATASNHVFEARGVVATTEGGTLSLSFAQNVSDAAAIMLRAGAYISATKIS